MGVSHTLSATSESVAMRRWMALVHHVPSPVMELGRTFVRVSPCPPLQAPTWAYKPPETEEEWEQRLTAYQEAIDMAQFTVDERKVL